MKLLKHVNDTTNKLLEDAAGGATSAGGGAVAGYAMPLFSTLVQRSAPKIKILTWGPKKKKKKNNLGLSETYHNLAEDFQDDTGVATAPNAQDTTFDTSEVMAKLKGLENRDKQDHRDTVTFGLEDENGNLVRVTVREEQAEDFERSLQAAMAEKDREGELPEIAELLFKMKDRFDIVDVEWPEVAEDEEQELSLEPGAEGGAPGEGEMGAPGEGEMGEMPPPETGAETGQVTDLLTQVIDMMKSDAEARKAEAKAREAEARTKEADALVTQAMTKVKQEEQYLDMDSYNKAKKEEEREAKRLAQLAKWKHDMEREEGVTDEFGEEDLTNLAPKHGRGAPEEEERSGRFLRPNNVKPQQPKKGSTIRGRVDPYDIASFILSRVK